MELDQMFSYLITVLALIASILAWISKIRWSKEFKEAKEAELQAKLAQMETIREKVELYESIISKKLIEYSKTTIEELELLLTKTEKSKQEEINKILDSIKVSTHIFKEKYKLDDDNSLLFHISHELRAPINAIMGFIELAKDDDIDEKDRKQFIEIVSQNAARLLSVIDDIFELLISSHLVNLDDRSSK